MKLCEESFYCKIYFVCVDVQSTDMNTDDNKSDTGIKKPHRRKKKKAMRRTIKEKNLVYLTQLEKEMLDWGIGGFLPMGTASFQPTECKPMMTQEHVRIFRGGQYTDYLVISQYVFHTD